MRIEDKTPRQVKDQKRSNIFNIIAFVALGLIAVIVGLVAYWSVANDDVLEVKNAPVPVRTIREHAESDGVVILRVDYCKKVGATGIVRTSFRGVSREVFLPPAEDKQPAQCNGGRAEPVEVPVLIPTDLPPGKYHIHFRVVYKINRIKEVIEEFDSQEFEVVAKGDSKSIPGVEEMQ